MSDDLFLQFLGNIPFFSNLSSDELMDIIRSLKILNFKKGDVLFNEGDQSDCMYVIESGMVKISKTLMQKDEKVLATLQGGAIFGEMSLIDKQPRSAKAVCLADATLYSLTLKDFDVMRANGKRCAYKIVHEIAKTISERLRETNEKIMKIFKDPEQSMRDLKSRYMEIREKTLEKIKGM